MCLYASHCLGEPNGQDQDGRKSGIPHTIARRPNVHQPGVQGTCPAGLGQVGMLQAFSDSGARAAKAWVPYFLYVTSRVGFVGFVSGFSCRLPVRPLAVVLMSGLSGLCRVYSPAILFTFGSLSYHVVGSAPRDSHLPDHSLIH
jgi:hypothetical protein